MKKSIIATGLVSLVSTAVSAAPYYVVDTSGIAENYTATDDAYSVRANLSKISPGGGLAFYSVYEHDENYTHNKVLGIGLFNITNGQTIPMDDVFSDLAVNNHTISSIHSPGYREDGTLILSVGFRDNDSTNCGTCSDFYQSYKVSPELTTEALNLPEDTAEKEYVGLDIWRYSQNSIISSKQIASARYTTSNSFGIRSDFVVLDIDTNEITHFLPNLDAWYPEDNSRGQGGYWGALTVEGDVAYGTQDLAWDVTASEGYVGVNNRDPDATVSESDWRLVRWDEAEPDTYEVILSKSDQGMSEIDYVSASGSTPDGKHIFGQASAYDIEFQECEGEFCDPSFTEPYWQAVNRTSSGFVLGTESLEFREVMPDGSSDTTSVFLMSALNNDIITGDAFDEQDQFGAPNGFAYSISNDAFYALNDYLGVDLPISWIRSINADSSVALASSCDFTLNDDPCSDVLVGIPQADALTSADDIQQPTLESGTGSVGSAGIDSTTDDSASDVASDDSASDVASDDSASDVASDDSASGSNSSIVFDQAPGWNGNVISIQDTQVSLANTVMAFDSAVSTITTIINGAHSNPLAHRLEQGEKSFWVKGDFGRDDHADKDGNFSIKELNFGLNQAGVQFNFSYGKTSTKQNVDLNSNVSTSADFFNIESIIPVSITDKSFLTLGAMKLRGVSDSVRGYENNGNLDYSTGSPDVDATAARVRLDFLNVFPSSVTVSPYVDYTRVSTSVSGYQEVGGFFPANFDERTQNANEFRIGSNFITPLTDTTDFTFSGEIVRSDTQSGPSTVGNIAGFDFDLPSPNYKKTWAKGSVGLYGRIDKSTNVSMVVNATTKGRAASSWVTLSYQKTF